MNVRRVAYLSGSPLVSTFEASNLPGPRAHILGTIKGFKANDCEVQTFIVGDRLHKWLERQSRPTQTISSIRPLLWDVGRISLGWLNSRMALRELGNGYDLVYERYGLFQSLGRRFQRLGVPWILETNAPMAYEAKNDRHSASLFEMAFRSEARAYRDCTVLVCVSDALREILREDYELPPDKIVVLPNGVDTDVYNPALYQEKRLFEGFTIGFVGHFYDWQGLDLAFKAFADLRQHGKEMYFVLVGDGPELGRLQALARSLAISRQVHFTGRVCPSDVPEMIAGFDVCFSGQTPPKKGKLYLSPLKLYEYMAMAKPVIASASSDALALIRNLETGFLFSPGDEAEMTSAMSSAYEARSNPSTFKRMGQKGRHLVASKHSWTARIRDLIARLADVLPSPIANR